MHTKRIVYVYRIYDLFIEFYYKKGGENEKGKT